MLLIQMAILGRANKRAAENSNRSVQKRREQIAGSDLFFLRAQARGYNWQEKDPDGLLPTVTGGARK